MKVKLYSYAKCSTCIKAIKFLKTSGIEPSIVDITEQPPNKAELKSMLQSYDGNIKKLFNTSGMVYRELNLKDKMANLTEDEAISLLTEQGKLVKRPFLLIDGKAKKVGFKEAEWKPLIG